MVKKEPEQLRDMAIDYLDQATNHSDSVIQSLLIWKAKQLQQRAKNA